MEVLYGTHHDLGPLKWQDLFAVRITADLLPDCGELDLLALTSIWLNEAQIQEELGHLSAAYLNVEVLRIHIIILVIDKLHLLANLDEVLVKAIIHDLVGFGTYLRCILVHG